MSKRITDLYIVPAKALTGNKYVMVYRGDHIIPCAVHVYRPNEQPSISAASVARAQRAQAVLIEREL